MSYDNQSGRGNSSCMFLLGNLLLMATGGVILVALLVVIGFWRTGDRFMEGIGTLFSGPQPTPQVDVRSVIVKQVRGASELTTAVFAMEAISPASQDRTFAGVTVGSTKLLYIAYGEVRAGVDLSELAVEDVEVISGTLHIRLPPPRILDSKIDVTRSRVYDYDRGFLGLGPDAPELQSLAEQEALEKIIIGACENGLLDEANAKAETTIAQLMSTAGYRAVFVETQPPVPGTCPTGP